MHKKLITNRFDVVKLKTEETLQLVQRDLETNLNLLKNQHNSVEELWIRVRGTVKITGQNHLQKLKRIKKQHWMTDEIVDLMDKRQKNKNINQDKYQDLHRHIRFKIRCAKESWLTEQCREIEELQQKFDCLQQSSIKIACAVFEKLQFL